MKTIPHKAKQFSVFIIKLLIVIAAFYFMYFQLANNDKLNWTKFLTLISKKQSVLGILFLLTFSIANRFLEILKWQNLVSYIKPISIGESTKQVLGALTVGVFTPVGLGEYAGKALFFEKIKRKKIILLNLICNGIQMLLTLFFGVIGLYILGYKTEVAIIVAAILFAITVSFFTKKIKLNGYSLEKLMNKIGEIPSSIHVKNNFLALGRYLVFSHQYYILFLAFDVNLPYLTMMATIATVYLIASSLPSFQFLDFAVKGSIAVFFFEKLGVNEWIVVLICTLMWFLNVVLPVIIGSYFVMRFKVPKKVIA